VGAISVGAGPVSRLVFLISNGPTGSFRSNGGAVGVSSSRGKLGVMYLGSAAVGTNCALLTVGLGTATSADRISVTTPYDAPAVSIVIAATVPVRGQSIGVPPAPIIIAGREPFEGHRQRLVTLLPSSDWKMARDIEEQLKHSDE